MTDRGQKISVVINTYNAEQHLKEVLESVKEFDEILICDMESTDRTLDIARQYGCRVVTFPKGDAVSAEPARTFAIQSAANHWVFVVDADELVTTELRNYLYQRISKADCPEGLYICSSDSTSRTSPPTTSCGSSFAKAPNGPPTYTPSPR